MVKKEISSDQNWKVALWKTAFRCVNATRRVTRLSSVFSLLTQFSGNLQWDTCEGNEACGDKGNILRWKLERSIVRNFLVMCEFISQSYTYVSGSSLLTLSLRKLRTDSLDRIEAYTERKFHPFKTWKDLSEKLLSDLWVHLIDLLLRLQEAVW